jgi:heme/copper-type cytochrome/quinol oxidase subunit 2
MKKLSPALLGTMLCVTASWAEPAAVTGTLHMDAKNPKSSWVKGTGWTYKGGFLPARLTVKQGQKVTINLESVGGTHCLNIPAFNVHSKKVGPGENTSVTFVPDKVGEFDFQCECEGPNHEQMTGKLSVTK